jgi:hypothetical protein
VVVLNCKHNPGLRLSPLTCDLLGASGIPKDNRRRTKPVLSLRFPTREGSDAAILSAAAQCRNPPKMGTWQKVEPCSHVFQKSNAAVRSCRSRSSNP